MFETLAQHCATLASDLVLHAQLFFTTLFIKFILVVNIRLKISLFFSLHLKQWLNMYICILSCFYCG
ncbi:MAG: hypothetical protein AUK44_06395 [Porphyromonadaceae bacterium CG2_30_38_12]|nr:MAG: hypothetical protein AUK44_06395 [Porphyromonadaceae bacterium CG2_30_38_12]